MTRSSKTVHFFPDRQWHHTASIDKAESLWNISPHETVNSPRAWNRLYFGGWHDLSDQLSYSRGKRGLACPHGVDFGLAGLIGLAITGQAITIWTLLLFLVEFFLLSFCWGHQPIVAELNCYIIFMLSVEDQNRFSVMQRGNWFPLVLVICHFVAYFFSGTNKIWDTITPRRRNHAK